MKKALSIVLALVLCLSLCACAGGGPEKALIGSWNPEQGSGGFYVFSEGGRFTCETKIAGLSLGVKEGSYEIGENVITLSYDNGVVGGLNFTYQDGALTIEGLVKAG